MGVPIIIMETMAIMGTTTMEMEIMEITITGTITTAAITMEMAMAGRGIIPT